MNTYVLAYRYGFWYQIRYMNTYVLAGAGDSAFTDFLTGVFLTAGVLYFIRLR
jgi:hypothetical protein